VDPADSAFDYPPGQGPGRFERPGFPDGPATLDAVPAAERGPALEACRARGVDGPAALFDCVLDLVCAGDEDLADAAAALPPAAGQDTPDLATDGAVGRIAAPPEVPTTLEAPDSACARIPPRRAAVFLETRGSTVSADLDVDIAQPGLLTPDARPGGTVPGGRRVDSFLLARPGGDVGERAWRGRLRFAGRILGVQAAADTLSGGAELAAPETGYPASPGGVAGQDRLRITPGGRALEFELTGERATQVRVVVETTEVTR
jgi:hypothetical protein